MSQSLPPFEIRASARRTKTASARFEAGTIVVTVPKHLDEAQRVEVAHELVSKLSSREDISLIQRAQALQEEFFPELDVPFALRWVGNQNTRWASCSPATGQIRVSNRLMRVPSWVLDAVLVHELAHLLVPSHSKAFKELVARNPRNAQADIFLEGYALGLAQAPKVDF